MTSSVPYQAYKSKRHSRNLSHLSPNVTPPPTATSPGVPIQSEDTAGRSNGLSPKPTKPSGNTSTTQTSGPNGKQLSEPFIPPSSSAKGDDNITVHAPSPVAGAISSPLLNGHALAEANGQINKDAIPSTSSLGKKPTALPRKSSTFRRVPPRGPAAPQAHLSSSPLRPTSTHSRAASTASNSPITREQDAGPSSPLHQLATIAASTSNLDLQNAPGSAAEHLAPETPLSKQAFRRLSNASSPAPTPPPVSPAPSSMGSTQASAAASRSATPPTTVRPPAPYRPGFQPKGVYRPLTDMFTSLRQSKSSANKIDRTKLQRRLEKLIQLHFPSGSDAEESRLPVRERRMSSIFDLDLSDPAGLWRGVVTGQFVQASKIDIRASEQRITPWQDDTEVSKCPLCLASFHPLTNRKHHCRLCGRIVCSLPVTRPQRPATCSLLFVVDPKTRRIEEVGEGVDYGVRKQIQKPKEVGGLDEEEKFLKGIRICRDCRPVLLRQQYQQEVLHVPAFVRLYEAFILLEKEIEDALPQFQELILTLRHEDRPTKEASNARKRLLDAFAQYDALSKRIRKLPCPGGAGSSQDRVQSAIMTRANLFLQKNMFPLQSIPRPTQSDLSPSPSRTSQNTDPDSELAHSLQPLLEQEALLEAYVEEANARRKFEDAKTLKANLREIQREIARVARTAEKNPGLARRGAG